MNTWHLTLNQTVLAYLRQRPMDTRGLWHADRRPLSCCWHQSLQMATPPTTQLLTAEELYAQTVTAVILQHKLRSNGGWLTQNSVRRGCPSPTILLLRKLCCDLSYGIKIWTHYTFVLWQITRLTDRRTDRLLIARPCLHSMQRSNYNCISQEHCKTRQCLPSSVYLSPWSFRLRLHRTVAAHIHADRACLSPTSPAFNNQQYTSIDQLQIWLSKV